MPQAGIEKECWFLLFTGVNTLLQKYLEKHETEECILKLCGYLQPQGTYTPQVGTGKDAGLFTVYRCQCRMKRFYC